MGEDWVGKFLKECVDDIVKAVLLHGVRGVLSEFESFLRRKGVAFPLHCPNDKELGQSDETSGNVG